MLKKTLATAGIMFLVSFFVSAKENEVTQKDIDAFNSFFPLFYNYGQEHTENVFDYPWEQGQSSCLIEKGKAPDFYSRDKAFDDDTSTAWVEGNPDSGIGEYIFCAISVDRDVYTKDFQYDECLGFSLDFTFVNGYAKNESLFKKNNRVKKIKIEVYEVKEKSSAVDHVSVLSWTEEFTLKDTMSPQTVRMLEKPSWIYDGMSDNYNMWLFAKITILDVYKGTAYDDTCISEIKCDVEYPVKVAE